MQRKVEINPGRFINKTTISISGILALSLLFLGIAGFGTSLRDKLTFYVHIAKLYVREPDAKLAMPLPEVLKKQVADTWHAARGSNRLHEGQDIFAPKGTPILSATSGYVYKIGDNTLGGHTVSVIGNGGRVYYYAHLDSFAPGIQEGDRVSTKSLLGYVGTTGNAQGTPPHLHFGVYTSSGAIDPLPLLVDRRMPVITNDHPKTTRHNPLISRRV
jgi:hypothetical protein